MVEFDSSGSFLLDWGSRETDLGQFYEAPRRLVFDDSSNIHVESSSTPECRVEVFSSLGGPQGGWAAATNGHVIYSCFNRLAINSGEKLHIADSDNHRILKYLLND